MLMPTLVMSFLSESPRLACTGDYPQHGAWRDQVHFSSGDQPKELKKDARLRMFGRFVAWHYRRALEPGARRGRFRATSLNRL